MANTQQQMPGTKDCTSCPAILNSTHHINKALIHNETENPLPRAWQKKKKKKRQEELKSHAIKSVICIVNM